MASLDLALIFNGIEPLAGISLLVASFIGSFITISLGIGGGVMLLAVMASLMPPAALIPVHGVIQLGSNGLRAGLMWRHTEWPPVFGFALGSFIGVVIGGLLVVELQPYLVQIGVGAFIIWSILARPPRWLARTAGLNGLVSSFLTMFFGATGPFVANYVKALALGRIEHIATQAVMMTIQHGLKITAFVALGFAYAAWLPFIALMIVSGFLGTLAGREVLLRVSDSTFKRALNIALFLIALRLIWQGLRGWMS